MKHHLDWSSYETAGQGDAYAGIPAMGGDFAKAVAVCIGDRLCQRTPKGVMCPSFRVTGDVAHSPGGRVQVLKAALNGEFGDQPFADPRLAEAMALCVGCKGCKRECANQVDMAAIKIEYQAQRNAALGPQLPFMGTKLDASALASWLGAAGVLLTGAGLFALCQRQLARQWSQLQQVSAHPVTHTQVP